MNCDKCNKQLTDLEIYAIEQLESYKPDANLRICLDCLEKRTDIVGKNGNDGLHYVH